MNDYEGAWEKRWKLNIGEGNTYMRQMGSIDDGTLAQEAPRAVLWPIRAYYK